MKAIDKIKHFAETRPAIAQLVFASAVIIAGILVFAVFMATRKDIERSVVTLPPPLVSVMHAEVGSHSVRITGEGTVRPLREIDLVPQVSGKIVHMAPALADGGAFGKGEMLLRIDPTDYELAVRSAEARVKDLESALLLTIEEAEVSLEEWKLSGEGAEGEEPPPLVAKRPQLDAARASLAAGKAVLAKAELDLQRTALRAPFDGRIIRKNVDLGQFVSIGQQLGSMYSTEAAEIAVPLPQEDLEWFYVPGFTPEGSGESQAAIHAEIAGMDRTWKGRIMRAEGVLDERTRMVNVIVRVEKPYASVPPLAMGLFVPVEITGVSVAGSAWLPRSAVRENSTVWIVDDGSRIRFEPVDVVRFDRDQVLVTGVGDGERVVTSPIKIVTNGMKVNYQYERESPAVEEAVEQKRGDAPGTERDAGSNSRRAEGPPNK
jgi:RND family efflux transporter MFP subunit